MMYHGLHKMWPPVPELQISATTQQLRSKSYIIAFYMFDSLYACSKQWLLCFSSSHIAAWQPGLTSRQLKHHTSLKLAQSPEPSTCHEGISQFCTSRFISLHR